MSVNLNLNRTNFQAQLRSKPMRENEIDIENAVNDLQSQVSALATAGTSTLAEITNARDYHSVLRDRLRSASKAQHNIVVSGGDITPQGTPDMTVHAAAGEAIVNGIACKWVASDSGTITAPTTARYDVVVANSDNSLSVVAGANTSAPFYPDIADSQVPLAVLSLTAGSTVINTAMITDARANLNYYFRNGADWEHIWNPGKRVRRQVFTSSGTWEWKSPISTVKVLLVAKGGNGGNGSSARGGGGGGGAGAMRKSFLSVDSNKSIVINSTLTSFGSLIATAGSNGANGASNQGGNGGRGGGFGQAGGGGGSASSSGNISGAGGDYGQSGLTATSGGVEGLGGTCFGYGGMATYKGGASASHGGDVGSGGGGGAGWGGNGGVGGVGAIGTDATNGGAGGGYGAGAGGGGGTISGGTPGTGGAGGPGLCIVEWEE